MKQVELIDLTEEAQRKLRSRLHRNEWRIREVLSVEYNSHLGVPTIMVVLEESDSPVAQEIAIMYGNDTSRKEFFRHINDDWEVAYATPLHGKQGGSFVVTERDYWDE